MGKILFVLITLFSFYAHPFHCDLEDGNPERLIAMVDPDGQIDFWDAQSAQNLSFCIGDRFSEVENKLSKALKRAATEWMKYANVNFKIREDLACESGSNVLFRIIPAPRRARYSARAFFPYYETERRVLRVKKKYIQNQSDAEAYRLMLHELGHILGFRHEQIHPDQGGTCPEKSDGSFDPITDYDPLSVMHYSRCKENGIKNYVLSELDKEGAKQAYPSIK